MQKPCEGHWSAAERVLRYLKGTQDLGIKYTQVDEFSLIGYSDSDFDGDKETGVSTSGYAMSLGLGVVSWRSRKQSVLADSTTKAKYVEAVEAMKEIVWLRKILEDLQHFLNQPNTGSPANNQASNLMQESPAEYEKKVREEVEKSWERVD
eukprot:PITA_03204